MILYEDSRQQDGKHKNIHLYCKRNGIELVRKCLSVGDYMIPGGNISVDTKQDVMELCKDVMSNDHRRFRRECERANELGIQLIILVEENVPYGIVDYWEVPRWNTTTETHRKGEPMTRVDPQTFRKALETMTRRYGVKFRYCTRKQTPSRVIKYLRGEFK